MGGVKFQKQAYEKGYEVSLKDSKALFHAYWELFSGVKTFSEMLASKVKRQGYLINPFGFRITPQPRTAFNYFIQSSVSGLLNIFNWKVFAVAPWASFVTVIHDELLVDVPVERLEEFRKVKERATDSLNEDLKWSVAIRTGFVSSTNSWYEAK
jgi:DNA polymerase I-like protein with 3'-5' exonuclease and polymerase domains